MKVYKTYNVVPCAMFHGELTSLSISFHALNSFCKVSRILGFNVNHFKLESVLLYITKFLNSTNGLGLALGLCNGSNLITFDDAIIPQLEVIKFLSLNKDRKILVFPSGATTREDNIPIKIMSNEKAHKLYHKDFKPPYPSTFMSSTEVWDLVDTNVKIGIHGWYHLYIGEDKNNHSGNLTNALRVLYDVEYSLVNVLRLLKEDAQKIIEWYINNIKDKLEYYLEDSIINLYYCTPYNTNGYLQEVYIEFLLEYLKKNDYLLSLGYDVNLTIFSNERVAPISTNY